MGERDIFDRFFDYLERIDHYLEIGLIDTEDVSSLDYWLKQIAASKFGSGVFIGYLEYFHFDGVLQLMKKFK